MCFQSYLLCIANTNFNMINRFITLCSVYIIIAIAMINICNARSNYNNAQPQLIGSHSKAMNQDNLEDAIKIFLQEWELHHHKSEPTNSGSVSHLYQNDHPNLMSNNHHINSNNHLTNSNNHLTNSNNHLTNSNNHLTNSNNHHTNSNNHYINSSSSSLVPNVSSNVFPSQAFRNKNITDEMINSYIESKYHNESSVPISSAMNCTRCVVHEEARSRRLETIKADILNKLGFKTAPNITSKTLPRIPHLQHLFPGYHAGMQSDDPQLLDPNDENSFIDKTNQDNDFEEFYVNAQRSISFAELRKLLPYYLKLFIITLLP